MSHATPRCQNFRFPRSFLPCSSSPAPIWWSPLQGRAGRNFPALNQRTTEGYEVLAQGIAERLDGEPYGVNLIVHKSNGRVDDDLRVTVRHRVPW